MSDDGVTPGCPTCGSTDPKVFKGECARKLRDEYGIPAWHDAEGVTEGSMYRIEPENRSDKVSRFMLACGVRAGVPVDAEAVHSMICDFCDVYVRDLEARMEACKKIAEDALALKLPRPIITQKK